MPPATSSAPPKKQSTAVRFAWFLAGAGVNYLLIATPFKYLRTHTALPIIAISACSLAVSACFFFFWNYFVNFRTDSRKRDALRRYIIAVIGMWILSTLTLFRPSSTSAPTLPTSCRQIPPHYKHHRHAILPRRLQIPHLPLLGLPRRVQSKARDAPIRRWTFGR